MNPGYYPQPLPRKHFVNVPVVSGYVTARLYAEDALLRPAVSQPDTCLFTIENTGANATTVEIRETDDRTVSGVRTLVVSGVSLVPGGQVTVTGTPNSYFMELACTGTEGVSAIRMQIESQREWRSLGFDKTDPFYPPQLWQGRPLPPG
jgi:hypothetical protein